MMMGELALSAGWPSMMRSYLNEEQRYAKCFADGWYLTGDPAAPPLVNRDRDGRLVHMQSQVRDRVHRPDSHEALRGWTTRGGIPLWSVP
jgi:hypothetical protein